MGEYYYNGKKLPRTTEIIKILNKEQLLYWSNYLGFKRINVKDELLRTGIIGTAVHRYIDEILKFKRISYDIREFKIYGKNNVDEFVNCVDSFTKFLRKNMWLKKELISLEKKYTCEDFGGTLDYIGRDLNGDTYILDFKTSKQFTISMFIQLAAYIILYEYNNEDKIKYVSILRLDKKNGDIGKILSYDRKTMKIFIEIFKYCLELYKLNERLKVEFSELI